MSNPLRRTLASVAVAGLAGTAAFTSASPAQSLPDPLTGACPGAFPIDQLVAGQPVDGLTVSSGTVPDQFTGEVLGVINDGIAPDLDMIVVRLTNPEIDRVGGIWAGMSGSPVYSADGRLIGAVAYGLAYGPSPVAGVTPAADMRELLTQSPALAAKPARNVALPAKVQKRVVISGAATATEAEAGLQRLPIPLGVSGTYNAARLNSVAKKLNLGNVKVYRAGSAPAAPIAPVSEIFAGSNLAASLAYGDFSAVATGTTTMVCDNTVVGFGHPLAFTGDSTATLHGSKAVYIQEDSLGSPFKVANPTAPVGVMDQDRRAGIKGVLGPIPDAALIHTVVTLGGKTRTGETHSSVPDFLPDATAFGFLTNLDRVFDHIGKGSSLVKFTITGHTKPGNKPFTVVRTNRYTNPGDITFSSMFEAADDVAALVFNEFTDVTIDTVNVSAGLSTQPRSFKVGQVQVKVKGVWKTLGKQSVIKAKPGRWLAFRVTLDSAKNALPSRVVQTRVQVPATATPRSGGSLSIGQAAGGDFGDKEFFGEGGFPSEEGGPATFDELVKSLSTAPRNDELLTQLDLFDESSESVTTSKTTKVVNDVLSNTRSWNVRIVK
jgi:hypothetical protein